MPSSRSLGSGGRRRRAIVGMNKRKVRLGQKLLGCEAEGLLPGRIQALEIAVEARHTKQVERNLKEMLELLLSTDGFGDGQWDWGISGGERRIIPQRWRIIGS